MATKDKTSVEEAEELRPSVRVSVGGPIVERMARIAAKAKYLQKKGNNSQQGYNYAQEADYLELAKPLLAEEGIWLSISVEAAEFRPMPATKSGTEREMCVVNVTGIFQCPGEKYGVSAYGTGIDSGDKAVYKAITGAVKYLIAKNLQIPTGDDPESDPETDKAPEPVRRHEEPEKGNGKATDAAPADGPSEDEFRAFLAGEKERLGPDSYKAAMKGFGYKNFESIPKADYRKVKKALSVLVAQTDEEKRLEDE